MPTQETASSIPCNLCGGTHVSVVSRRSRSGRPLRSVACTACGLVWSDPRPYEARRFYEEDYRLAYKQTVEPRPKHVLRAGRVALSRLEKVSDLLRGRMSILDVGSGGGEFAYLLKSLGHDVVGAEPNRGYADYAARQYGLAIRRGFIGDIALAAQSFDLITVWHVLEHTEDPGAVLRQLCSALRPGGTLVIEVPNLEATCQSPRSSFHEAHVYTFNAPVLDRLAAKNGLQALGISLSRDAGNITARYAAAPAMAGAVVQDLRLPGNHQRITGIVAAHTPLSHTLSSHPWRRAAGRLGRALSERWALRSGLNGRELLDGLYAPAAGLAAQPDAPRRTPWAWLAGAYALAIGLEEALLDGRLPLGDLGASQAMGIYVALQCAVIGTLFWALKRRTGSGRDLMKLGGWAAPLFAVPIIC